MKRSSSSSKLIKAHSTGSFSRFVFESEANNGGGHHDRSILFRICQVVVVVMRLVTPISYVYLIGLLTNIIKPIQYTTTNKYTYILFLIFTLWMISEAIFFPYYYYLFSLLNHNRPSLQHLASNKKSRMRLVKNCFQALRLSAQHVAPELSVRKVKYIYMQ